MATTQIADVIVPEIFAPYLLERSVQTNRLLASGAVRVDESISAKLAGGGTTFNVPSFQNTANTTGDEDVSSDNPATVATPSKISASNQISVRLERNKTWSSADLAAALAGADPMESIASNIGAYQNNQRNKTLVNVLAGVVGSATMTNHLNDVFEDLASPTTGQIDAENIIDTTGAWGDFLNPNRIFVIHSNTYRVLQKANLITFEPTSAQNIGFGTYLGMTLYVDDGLPIDTSPTNADAYTSYIFNAGAVGFGATLPRVPVEVDREPLQGNGGGIEILAARQCYAMHVYGMKWTGTPAGATPTNAELATVGNWARVLEDKEVGVAAIRHNING